MNWQLFEHAVPRDLTGKSVLDVGCDVGVHSIEMKRRGAARVVGIDSDDGCLGQARLAADASGFPDIDFRNMSVYDVGKLGERFDVVIFMGVLYGLRHPLLALDILYDTVVADMLIFPSTQRVSGKDGLPVMYLAERRSANWWIPNRPHAEALLRSAGFSIESEAGDEVYICRREERPADA